MNGFFSIFDSIGHFLDSGGIVLKVILFVSVGLWCLIAERLLYFRFNYPKDRQVWLEQWESRVDKSSYDAHNIRNFIISEAKLAMGKSLTIIKMLIGLCPLLGLLGTVTGMIHVFDVMAVTGTGNARAMASGISLATIPTMSGMVIAIAGLYFSKTIEERVSDETHHLADLLKFQ
ncbi:MotA/TolQ/ExbB proton channel family protein [Methylotuvimicrobium buryatense]|uniref:MotA/TolQ/ExbB proton channel family protein n=1 Tax=Methylotuvimicrobium buryatense TaxID=95641 RepID=A0A4P9USQ4_METBY|nr:MotA/TolQ/ExbB proton channel family protein [Methylotuvimicrobium buryatense]QCW84564.1 MotA/TolQ/ExbB proton channel family protein [Methylotuvimicrobium buryatense]